MKDPRGRLYLAAADTRVSLLQATGVSAALVNDLIGATRARRVILMLDCCYSGAVLSGRTHRADEQVDVYDQFAGNRADRDDRVDRDRVRVRRRRTDRGEGSAVGLHQRRRP